MGGIVFKKGTFRIVRQVIVDRERLERIAEVLDIPEAERDQVISGTESIQIYVGAPPSPPTRRRPQRK
jgi:hypothetical protein